MTKTALVDAVRDKKKKQMYLKNCNCTEKGENKSRKVGTVIP